MKMVYIPPIGMLQLASSYHRQLMLPAMISQPMYRDYMRRQQSLGNYIILDNGVNEKQEATSDELVRLAHEYHVGEIVMPDAMGDFIETLNRGLEFYNGSRGNLPPSTKLGFVLHGRTASDVVRNYSILRAYSLYKSISIIYLPRMLVGRETPLERVIAADIISGQSAKQIHFLGASAFNVEEGREVARRKLRIRSMDTSAPFVYALQKQSIDCGKQLNRDHETYFSSPVSITVRQLAEKNCEIMNAWCSETSVSVL